MKFEIDFDILYTCSNKEYLKNALVYLLPIEINNIFNIIDEINFFDVIHVKNNKISFNNIFESDVHVDDCNTIKIVNIIRKIKYDSFLIHVNNEYECNLAYKIFGLENNFLNSDLLCDFYFLIYDDNDYEIIFDDAYKIFFNKYKTIDVNTYLRSLKLNIMIK